MVLHIQQRVNCLRGDISISTSHAKCCFSGSFLAFLDFGPSSRGELSEFFKKMASPRGWFGCQFLPGWDFKFFSHKMIFLRFLTSPNSISEKVKRVIFCVGVSFVKFVTGNFHYHWLKLPKIVTGGVMGYFLPKICHRLFFESWIIF